MSATREEKRAAHKAVHLAILSGELVRPKACSLCHDEVWRINGHHVDYSKQLEVRWLCGLCHSKVHREGEDAKPYGKDERLRRRTPEPYYVSGKGSWEDDVESVHIHTVIHKDGSKTITTTTVSR